MTDSAVSIDGLDLAVLTGRVHFVASVVNPTDRTWYAFGRPRRVIRGADTIEIEMMERASLEVRLQAMFVLPPFRELPPATTTSVDFNLPRVMRRLRAGDRLSVEEFELTHGPILLRLAVNDVPFYPDMRGKKEGEAPRPHELSRSLAEWCSTCLECRSAGVR